MASLVLGGVYSGGALIAPATSAELLLTGSGGTRELRLVDFGAGVLPWSSPRVRTHKTA